MLFKLQRREGYNWCDVIGNDGGAVCIQASKDDLGYLNTACLAHYRWVPAE